MRRAETPPSSGSGVFVRLATCSALFSRLNSTDQHLETVAMPTLTVNGKSIPFEPGATILEAARTVGIDIPTLCWYPKLPIVGNCRICLVSVQGQNKLLPACATPAADGMVVDTESKPAADSRRGVLDFLLERYPGEHLSNGGRSHPRNEFERYVVQY